eukprot:gene2467-3229_t
MGKFADGWFGIDTRAVFATRSLLAAVMFGDLLLMVAGDWVTVYLSDHDTFDLGALPDSLDSGFLRNWWVFVLMWLLTLSIQRRTMAVSTSGELWLRIILFWLMFVPEDILPSLPRFHNRLHSGQAPQHQHSVFVGPASAALFLQTFVVYFSSPTWRVTYRALEMSLRWDTFATSFGRALLAFPSLLQGLTYFTIFGLETILPCLLLAPLPLLPYGHWLRGSLVSIFVIFHLGLLAVMELGPYPMVGCAAWLLFLPVPFWDAAENFVWKMSMAWAMFAPDPHSADGWPVVFAQLHNNSTVDLAPAGDIQLQHKLLLHICYSWNSRHVADPDYQAVVLQYGYMKEETLCSKDGCTELSPIYIP